MGGELDGVVVESINRIQTRESGSEVIEALELGLRVWYDCREERVGGEER